MSGNKGNRSLTGERMAHARCRDEIGLSPAALDVLTAVMAFERLYGISPTRRHVAAFLGTPYIHLNELTAGLWLTAEGTSNADKKLTARAWSVLGFRRDRLTKESA